MKKLFMLAAAALLTFGMVSCDKNDETTNNDTTTTTTTGGGTDQGDDTGTDQGTDPGNANPWANPNPGTTSGEWVDLGLPSGLLWYSVNLGAAAPEHYGDYYAWGETKTKEDYSWSTYAYGSASNQLTKYCNNSEYGLDGYTDNLTTLQSSDDAATAVIGKGARIPTKDEWQELQTRWHQFGTFVPLFRTHGQWPQRELWNIAPEGSPAYESILWYMNLRYRLMPYIYSLTGAVCFDDATIMRGLPMDFPKDREVRDLSDQWLFGPALMPCPVYEYKARSRSVYFPHGGWYDFYCGKYIPGGKRLTVDAPYERMPLYVRQGSILPIGPEMEWSNQKPDDDMLLLVYSGADAHFVLYQDDGLTYGYERGEYSRIELRWNDAAKTLEIGAREGSYPGMPGSIRFRVTVVSPEEPFAFDPDAPGSREVTYTGAPVTLNFNLQ